MVTEFLKYPKIKQLGNSENAGILTEGEELIIEEKVDGANFRFMVHNGNLIFGSRENQITSDLGEDAMVDKNFRRCVEYIRNTFKVSGLSSGYIFYGENCVKHSMDYDWKTIPPFLGYDIWSTTENKFLSYNDKIRLFNLFNLPVINLVKRGIYGKDITFDDFTIPESAYVKAPAEGIVIKNYSKQLFAKKVSDKFKEVNRATFGGGKKEASDDNQRVVATYCTNARIDKWIFKLIDSGEKLDLPMMHHLPNKVVEDIYDEHWKEILMSDYKLNLREIRGLISKRCLAVLKQIMTNQAINGEVK